MYCTRMNFDTIQTLKPALFSMTRLETLKLLSDDSEPSSGVGTGGLKILAKAPILENLTELALTLESEDEAMYPPVVPEVLKPLTALLRRCGSNLKILSLSGAPSLVALLATPVFSSGKLPQLKTLRMSINAQYPHDYWAQCMQRINLPSLETLYLSDAFGHFTSNDVFRIAEAAPNIPKLRDYVVNAQIQGTVADSQLVSEFFSSAICRNLEILQLVLVKLSEDGFKKFIENASNMARLKTLFITVITERDVQSIANAGVRGGCPQLQKLTIICSREPLFDDEGNVVSPPLIDTVNITDFRRYCKDLFDPIWPILNLGVY